MTDKLIVNELLFYIQNKIHVTTKDAIVETCVKFYSLDEITDGISVLESELKIRLSKRKNADDLQSKLLNDLYDKIWSLDAAGTQIPRFVAKDLSRIPRENQNSESLVSTEQLLASVHSLKSTVIYLRDNMVTRAMLESTLDSRSASSSNSLPSFAPPPVSASMAFLTPASSSAALAPALSSASLTPSTSLPPSASLHPTAPPAPLSPSAPDVSNASLSKTQYAGVVQRQHAKMPRPPRPGGKTSESRGGKSSSIVIGKKVNAGVVSWKGADLTIAKYIGHCAIGTTTDDIKSTLDLHGVEIISLEAVETKHNRFASFKLVAKKAQKEIIENGEIWPEGVRVGRWWSPKTASAVTDPTAAGSNLLPAN